MKEWEHYFLQIIRKQKRGWLPSLIRFNLWLLSFPYRIFVFLRNYAYDKGWFSRYMPPCPLVISVGNLVAGGVGKTPVTLMIAEQFYPETPLAILSRGYRSEAEKLSHPVIVSRGKGPTHPASYTGDEAYLAAERLPKAIVVVAKNRQKASNTASRLGAQVILLDDGLQHRRIARDKEVVVMDIKDPYGLNFFLPRGLLREDKSALKRADLIILNHTSSDAEYEKIKKEILKFSSAPVIGTCMKVNRVVDLETGKEIDVKNKKTALFSGIAHPDYFAQTVRDLGCDVIGELILADHVGVEGIELEDFSKNMKKKGATLILCTEKDRVKLPPLTKVSLPIGCVETSLSVVKGHEHFALFIEQSKEMLRN